MMAKQTVFELNDSHKKMKNAIMKTMEQADSGEIELLRAVVQLRKTKEEIDDLNTIISTWLYDHSSQIESEMQDYPEGYAGYKISVITPERLDFSKIEAIVKLEKELKKLKAAARASHKVWSETGNSLIDQDTGEIIERPEVVESKTQVRFAKQKN